MWTINSYNYCTHEGKWTNAVTPCIVLLHVQFSDTLTIIQAKNVGANPFYKILNPTQKKNGSPKIMTAVTQRHTSLKPINPTVRYT